MPEIASGGALAGVRVIEIAAQGPAPFAAMLLGDMGAEVLRIDRPDEGAAEVAPDFLLRRNRRSVVIDLKHPDAAGAVLRLVELADVVIEGFRPGVAERLGIGPDPCLGRNARLVYGRMTGWGQDGPLASTPGHDINYIALAGVLGAIGRAGAPPVPPLNLVGDFGGGGMLLAFGILCALVERAQSHQGQVVDAAMVDGSALLMTMFHGLVALGAWVPDRGANVIDSGAPFYEVYETAEGAFVSVGALEPKFYAELVRLLGLDASTLPAQADTTQWPVLKGLFADRFKSKTSDEWCAVFAGSECCFAPVLSIVDAPRHPHNEARGTFVDVDGVVQPAPAPRLSRTPGQLRLAPPRPGEHTDEALRDWGFTETDIGTLRAGGALGAR
jgi:alpha-methylacyl-CoA racemase